MMIDKLLSNLIDRQASHTMIREEHVCLMLILSSKSRMKISCMLNARTVMIPDTVSPSLLQIGERAADSNLFNWRAVLTYISWRNQNRIATGITRSIKIVAE